MRSVVRVALLSVVCAVVAMPYALPSSVEAQLEGPGAEASALEPSEDVPAEAAPVEEPTAANPDPFANESFRPLLVVRNATLNMTPLRAGTFFEMLDLSRRYGLLPSPQTPGQWRGESLRIDAGTFDAALSGADPGAGVGAPLLAAARSWCRTATAEMQETRGAATVGSTLESLTTDAVQERCSQLLDLELAVSAVNDAECQGGTTCTINVRVALRRFVVNFDDQGQFVWRQDPNFGQGGVFSFEEAVSAVKPVGLDWIPLLGSRNRRNFNAYGVAARDAALQTQKFLQSIPELQTRALVAAVAEGDVRFCGSREDIVLDTPFYIRYQTAQGPVDAGYVVARNLTDGCAMTSTLQQRESEGASLSLEPSTAQIIAGEDDIRPGMTLWEIPYVGLNFVWGLGTTPSIMTSFGSVGDRWQDSYLNFFQPTLSLGIEYNFGRHMGASETWFAVNLELGSELGYGNTTTFYDDDERSRPSLAIFARPEVGLLKRYYTGGRFYLQFGVYGHYGISLPLATESGLDYGLPMAAGGRLEIGLGWQVSPFTQFRVDLGARGGFAFANAGILGTVTGLEFGPVMKMAVSHAF